MVDFRVEAHQFASYLDIQYIIEFEVMLHAGAVGVDISSQIRRIFNRATTI